MAALVTSDGVTAGYLRVGGHELAVLITHAGAGRTGARSLEGCARLRQALAGQETAVLRRLQHSASVDGFVSELREMLERQLADVPASSLPPAEFYDLLIREIDAVGWSSLVQLSPSLDEVALSVADAAGRAHTLRLRLPASYPAQPPVPSAALPSPFELRWPSGEMPSLAGAVGQFRAALRWHQMLWDELDDLDAHAWVLEPKHPGRDETHRRIALGNHCSLQVRLHPSSPTALPDLQFLGAERSLAPFRRNLNANLRLWCGGRRVRLNLEAVLEVEIPSREAADAADADDYSVECAICYEYELDDAVPDVACDGCSKPFHRLCLVEWLQGLPTTQTSFNRLFGECVYCSKPITVEAGA